tara:strand:- start:16324 stop:16818 length:495 start_codon:yes stop_codon:yes gene_type:complete
MAGSLNRVTLIGHLGKDPESKSFQNGGKVVNFSIATSETWKDKNSGEKREKTDWHNVAVFQDGLTSIAENYLRKGSKVMIEGKLQTRKWQDQSGNDRYSTEVVLQGFDAKILLLDGKDASSGSDRVTDNATYGQDRRSAQAAHSDMRGTAAGFGDDDLDDSVPF